MASRIENYGVGAAAHPREEARHESIDFGTLNPNSLENNYELASQVAQYLLNATRRREYLYDYEKELFRAIIHYHSDTESYKVLLHTPCFAHALNERTLPSFALDIEREFPTRGEYLLDQCIQMGELKQATFVAHLFSLIIGTEDDLALFNKLIRNLSIRDLVQNTMIMTQAASAARNMVASEGGWLELFTDLGAAVLGGGDFSFATMKQIQGYCLYVLEQHPQRFIDLVTSEVSANLVIAAIQKIKLNDFEPIIERLYQAHKDNPAFLLDILFSCDHLADAVLHQAANGKCNHWNLDLKYNLMHYAAGHSLLEFKSLITNYSFIKHLTIRMLNGLIDTFNTGVDRMSYYNPRYPGRLSNDSLPFAVGNCLTNYAFRDYTLAEYNGFVAKSLIGGTLIATLAGAVAWFMSEQKEN